MATSKNEIGDWFDVGKSLGKDFMIIACDTFEYEDYPIYCTKDEVRPKYNSHNGQNMQTVMEVYDLNMDKNVQLKMQRCFNLPKE